MSPTGPIWMTSAEVMFLVDIVEFLDFFLGKVDDREVALDSALCYALG